MLQFFINRTQIIPFADSTKNIDIDDLTFQLDDAEPINDMADMVMVGIFTNVRPKNKHKGFEVQFNKTSK